MEASTSEMKTSLMSSEMEKKAPPSWMLRVMEKNNGFNPCFFGEKMFTTTDTDANQNGFVFHKDHILDHIVLELMEQELDIADLVNINKEEKNKELMKKINGRVHKGLSVTLYTMYGCKFNLVLTHWGSKSVILKGREWNFVPLFSNLQFGDHIEVWSFHKIEHGSLNLCFVVGKVS